MPDDVVFETERLQARKWRPEHAEPALVIYGDPEVTRYIGGITWANLVEAEEGMAGFVERSAQWGPGLGGFPLFRRTDDALVGAVLVKYLPGVDRSVATSDLEVGWHLARRYQGQGYATEAGRGALDHAFTRLAIDEITAVTEPDNHPSQRVARRLGMVHVGRTSAYYGGLELERFVLTRAAWAVSSGQLSARDRPTSR